MLRSKTYILIFCLAILVLEVNSSFSLDQGLHDKKWNDLEKMPQSLPTPVEEESKKLPTPLPQEPLKDIRFQEKYRFPQQNIPDFNQNRLIVDQKAQDKAVIMNQKRWQAVMESQKVDLFKRFDEWLEEFNIPKEYHFAIELLIAALFIVCLGVMFYRKKVKRQEKDEFSAYTQHKYNRNQRAID
jgi:hypothetical protein